MTRAEQASLITDVLDIAENMLLNGAEISRVEDTVTRLFFAYGAERVDVLTILSDIEVTVTFDSEAPITRFRRVHADSYDTDLASLEKWNALSRRLCAAPQGEEERRQAMREILSGAGSGSRRSLCRAAGYLLAAGSFAVFFGGGAGEGLFAAAAGLTLWQAGRSLNALYVQKYLQTFLLAALTGLLSLLGKLLSLEPGPVAIGCIMLLIPGVGFTVSVRDMLSGDTISGALRMLEAVLTACFVGLGLLAAMTLSGGSFSGGMTGMASHSLIQILTAASGSLGFALVYRTDSRHFARAALAGFLTWGAYVLLELSGAGNFLCSLAAAAVGALYAEAGARAWRLPSLLLLMPALIPLVPGRALFLTMDCLVSGSNSEALGYALLTASTALALAGGTVLVSSGMRSAQRFSQKKNAR